MLGIFCLLLFLMFWPGKIPVLLLYIDHHFVQQQSVRSLTESSEKCPCINCPLFLPQKTHFPALFRLIKRKQNIDHASNFQQFILHLFFVFAEKIRVIHAVDTKIWDFQNLMSFWPHFLKNAHMYSKCCCNMQSSYKIRSNNGNQATWLPSTIISTCSLYQPAHYLNQFI